MFESGMHYSSIAVRRGSFRRWMKKEVYKRKVDTADKLLARNLDAADSIKKRGD